MEILNKIHITPNTIVLGDFNTRLGSIVGDTKSNSRRTPFLEWVQRHDLHIWNTTHAKGKCTFENHQGKSIIDFFISPYNLIPNPSSLHIHSDVTVGSDHYLCSMELPLPGNIIQKITEKNASPPPRQIWRLAKFEEWEVRDSYIDHFTTISAPLYDNLMSVYQQLTSSTSSSSASNINFGTPRPKDIEAYTEELNQSIYSALDLTVGRTGNRPPDWNWYWNKHLDDIAQQRTKLFRHWKRSAGRSPFDRLSLFQAYTKQNQILHSEIKKAKRANWRHLCNKLRNNPVEMMASIKRKRLSQRTNVTYTHPDGPEAAVTSMVQHLDRVFGNTPSTASSSSSSLPISTPHPSSPSTTLPEHIEQYYTPSRIQHDLHLHSNPVSDEYDLDLQVPWQVIDIVDIIKALANRKAPGTDHIRAEMLKPIKRRVSKILYILFSLCWHWSITPSFWRTAQVVPIFKKGDSSDPANYRPISLTSIFRKILERCIAPTLHATMPYLDISQGGFRPSRGTLDQALCLPELMHDYTTSTTETSTDDTGQSTISIIHTPPVVAFLDIKAAYDSVNRLIIWQSLAPYIPKQLLQLLMHLFDNTLISVIINNHTSHCITAKRGVLQGSILSPTLYSVFIDSLPRFLRNASRFPTLIPSIHPDNPTHSLASAVRDPSSFITSEHANPISMLDNLREDRRVAVSSYSLQKIYKKTPKKEKKHYTFIYY
jgi:hypothetical protein